MAEATHIRTEDCCRAHEVWRPVPGHDGYEASSRGRVRSVDRVVLQRAKSGAHYERRLLGRILAGFVCPTGHVRVFLGRGNPAFVHELVLTAFVGPRPNGMECRHLDGRPAHNCPGNLAWGTRVENMADRKRLGEAKAPRGMHHRCALLSDEKVRFIRSEAKTGRVLADIARELGVHPNVVYDVMKSRTWDWLA